MAHGFDLEKLHLIFAEDELVFREIAMPAIHKAGIPEERVYPADDGLAALEHLEALQATPGIPVIMLCDVRMPNMDGNQCAQRVKEMVSSGSLVNEPYMVCCSAGIREVSYDDGDFHMTMPKPFSGKEVDLCLEAAWGWWQRRGGGSGGGVSHSVSQSHTGGASYSYGGDDNYGGYSSGGGYSGSGGGGGGEATDLKLIEMIVADDEPICRMAVVATVAHFGSDDTVEAEDEHELVSALERAQDGDSSRPLMLLIGNPSWMEEVQSAPMHRRKPFIVCTSVDSDRFSDGTFNATLPRTFQQADLREVCKQCLSWWNRGCV